MSHENASGLEITLLGKKHLVACPLGQEQALEEAATKLNQALTEAKARSQFRSDDKALLMVALNLCHQLRSMEQSHEHQLAQLVEKLSSCVE